MAQQTAAIRAERRRLRAVRLALPRTRRVAAERAIVAALRRLRIFRRGRRVAAYLAMPGEVSIAGALAAALGSGVDVFVPQVVSRRLGRMRFVRLRQGAVLRSNAFGIQEPTAGEREWSPPGRLDVVLVPIVGFDREGNRLGMGAGFYDRALRQRRDRSREWRRPRLIGLAFACQEVARIEPATWDVPLDLVVTESEVVVPRRAAAGGRWEDPA